MIDQNESRRLRAWRKALNLTKAQLAAVFRVTMRQVNSWESGASRVPGPVSLVMDLASDKRLDLRFEIIGLAPRRPERGK